MAFETGNFKHGFPSPGPQDPTGHQVMDHVFFLSQSEFKHAREENDYDIIIVGSGFCALAVAERALKNDPFCKILILERGTFFLPEHFQNLPLPYASTLGGLSETFPWTMSAETTLREDETIRWQHGMVPFFGGRSTVWSAWCPEPTADEMHGWPEITKTNVHNYLESAEELLHVQKVNEVDSKDAAWLKILSGKRPVYGVLQDAVGELSKDAVDVEGIYRVEPAPLACNGKTDNRIDFLKYSVPGELLALASKQATLHKAIGGAQLHIATNCIVEKIYQQDGIATALGTSRGVVPIADASLVLAMGTLPPTTLVRNSFPQINIDGDRFSAHFISAITARVPRKDLEGEVPFGDLEIGAFYIAGKGKDYRQQFHIQMSVLSDKDPENNAQTALRYMPDVVATASMEQLKTSEDFVIFVCAVLGELDTDNPKTWFRKNSDDSNPTTNSMLQVIENDSDRETWDAMDEATFGVLEQAFSPKGAGSVQYWHGSPDSGEWRTQRPLKAERRVDGMVHESSTLHIGEEESDPVGLDYRLRGTQNVYITGGALWPRGGSLNPTLVMVALAQHLADNLTKEKKPKRHVDKRNFLQRLGISKYLPHF